MAGTEANLEHSMHNIENCYFWLWLPVEGISRDANKNWDMTWAFITSSDLVTAFMEVWNRRDSKNDLR